MPTQINMKRLGAGPAPTPAKGAIVRAEAKGNLNNVKENITRSTRTIEATTSRKRAEIENLKSKNIDIRG